MGKKRVRRTDEIAENFNNDLARRIATTMELRMREEDRRDRRRALYKNAERVILQTIAIFANLFMIAGLGLSAFIFGMTLVLGGLDGTLLLCLAANCLGIIIFSYNYINAAAGKSEEDEE